MTPPLEDDVPTIGARAFAAELKAQREARGFSSSNGGNCVEVARNIADVVAVRDSNCLFLNLSGAVRWWARSRQD